VKPVVYCASCATKLDDRDSEGGSTCPNCGRSWFQSFSPTVTAAIVQDDRVLVAIRGIEPKKGKADTPGGFLKPGEDPLEGLRRELREELGVEVDVSYADFVQGVPHTYGEEDDWVLSLGFAATLVSGDIVPADDVAEARWVTYGELDDLDFAWPHDRELAKKVLTKSSTVPLDE
jgi:NADH pyrophosphatase NudC (nudix superfamily)